MTGPDFGHGWCNHIPGQGIPDKKPVTNSDAKVALEEAIKLCLRANMDDSEIRKYTRSYLAAIQH